jgi:hypothetical protein
MPLSRSVPPLFATLISILKCYILAIWFAIIMEKSYYEEDEREGPGDREDWV